jgi:hypothetical protein
MTRYLFRLVLASTLGAVSLLAPIAHAQEPIDSAPIPLPITAQYVDGDGVGSLIIEAGMQIMIYPQPPGQPLQVTLLQGGVRYHGAGRVYEPDAFGRALIAFTLYSPRGRGYTFEGTLTPNGMGQGTYYAASSPNRRFGWVIYLE